MVAEAEQVQLQALTLDHALARHVGDVDRGEVGLPGDWAQAGELGAVELHEVVVARVLVLEGFEHARVVGLRVAHALVAQKRQVVGPFALWFLVHRVFHARCTRRARGARHVRRVRGARHVRHFLRVLHVRHAIPLPPRLPSRARRRACRAADRASRSPRTRGCGRCTSRTRRTDSRRPRSSSR